MQTRENLEPLSIARVQEQTFDVICRGQGIYALVELSDGRPALWHWRWAEPAGRQQQLEPLRP
jgi:hypothetical protein